MVEYIKREDAIEAMFKVSKDNVWIPFYNEQLLALEGLPAADVQPVKWIPVGDALPDFEGSCLCMIKNGDGTRAQDRLFFHDGVFTYNGIYPIYGTVTHWMTLPEPPREDEV